MNETLKTLQQRRSIRSFTNEMPKAEDIDAVINAGLYAANGRGRQAVITIAVTDKAMRDKISEDNRRIGGWDEGFDPFYGAPVILIVLGDKRVNTHVYDGALVMGNMMNAAQSLGLGSIWIHRAKEEFEMPDYKELLKKLGIDGEWEGIGHCALGFPAGDIPNAEPRNEGRVYRI